MHQVREACENNAAEIVAAAVPDAPITPLPPGESPDAEKAVYWEMVLTNIRETPKFLNDVNHKVMTLSVAILGASFFVKDDLIHSGFRLIAIACFLVALSLSFIGVMPFRGPVERSDPDDCERHIDAGIAHKELCLWIAGGSVIAGFAVALGGLVCKALNP